MTWWRASESSQIKSAPWLHPAAVAYLDYLIRDDMEISEHGCGGSTLWLAARCHHVIACDSNHHWIKAVQEAAPLNVRLIETSAPPIWFPPADLLLIDGKGDERGAWIDAAPRLVKPGGIIVIDNAERALYQLHLARLANVCSNPLIIETRVADLGEKLVRTAFYRLEGGETWI